MRAVSDLVPGAPSGAERPGDERGEAEGGRPPGPRWSLPSPSGWTLFGLHVRNCSLPTPLPSSSSPFFFTGRFINRARGQGA